jgi:hypothetical protein
VVLRMLQQPQRSSVSLLVVLLFAATACGGDHPTRPSGSAILGKTFYTKAVALCDEALREKRAEPAFPYPAFNPTQPDPSKLPGIGRYEMTGVTIFTTWLGKMVALGQPPRGQAAWSAVIAALRTHTRIITEQQAAAIRGDATTFTKDYNQGNTAQSAMVRAADAAGVPICATAAGA